MAQKLTLTLVDASTGIEHTIEYDDHRPFLSEITARRAEYEIIEEVTETRLVVRRKAGDLFSQSDALYRR